MDIDFLKELTDKFQYAIHGGIGGILKVILGEEKSFKRGLLTMVVGASTAHYFTPLIEVLIVKYAGIDFSGYGLSFVIGYSGLIILKKIENWMNVTTLGKVFKRKQNDD